jgi:iron complex outermembrane receptor protein
MGSMVNFAYLSKRTFLSFLLISFSLSITIAQQKSVNSKTGTDVAKPDPGADSTDVGYSRLKESDIVSSVAIVKSEEFNKGFIANPIQLIQGKVAGLSISKPGGDPNGMFNIRLRGLSTVCGNTEPLIIIDGVIGASLDNIDPDDIESINVLKDGSAAIFTPGGSGGVIVVNTKKERAGKTLIEYNASATSESVSKNNPSMNSTEWRSLSKETGMGTDFGSNTDWLKQIEQTSISQVHNIAISAGTDKTSYRASINYRDVEGVIINTGYNQLNGRIALTQKALNDCFTLDINLAATQRESKNGFPDAIRYASIYNPTSPVRNSSPQYASYDGYFQQILYDYYNPVSILELNKNEGKNIILNTSVKGTYEIIKGLAVEALYSRQSYNSLGGQYYDKNDYWGGFNRNGLASRNEDNSSSQLFESMVSYNGKLTSKLNLSMIGGYYNQSFINEGFYAQGGNFLTDYFTFNNLGAALDFKNGKGQVSSYKNSSKDVMFFSQIDLDFERILFLKAGTKYEGSSHFMSGNKWGVFPSAGFGLELSKLLNLHSMDNINLRADYSMDGNKPDDNVWLNIANADIKWEKNGEFDAGFYFTIFRSRLSGSFDFYTSTTNDLLYQYQTYVTSYYMAMLNLGKLKSSGLELNVKYEVIKKSDFSYGISINSSFNIANNISLSGTVNGTSLNFGEQDLGAVGSPGQNQVPLVRVQNGKPVGQLIAFIFKSIDSNGNFSLVDINHDGHIDQSDRKVVGNGLPKFIIGFGNTITYKNWDMDVSFRGVAGHDLINSYRALYEVPYMISSYNLPKTATDMRNSSNGKFLNASSGTLTDLDVENASFISLDNISLGYTFRLDESSKFSKIRLYFAGNNLFYLTRYKGSDPNPRYTDNASDLGTYNSPLVPGIDRMKTWPRTRSVTFGANIVF